MPDALCWLVQLRSLPEVEGLPSARLHSPNDVFCEATVALHSHGFVRLLLSLHVSATHKPTAYTVDVHAFCEPVTAQSSEARCLLATTWS